MSAKRGKAYAINKNKYLSEPEFEKLELLLKRYMFKEKRNCMILLVAMYTGARAQEILNLQIEDMDLFNQTLFIRGIKGSNDREIPVPAWVFDALEDYSKTLKGPDLFPISYHRLRQIWDHYRPVKKKFHSLRHTFAIRLYKKIKDLRLLQVALGHRNITNTMVYADYVYSQSEMRKLIL